MSNWCEEFIREASQKIRRKIDYGRAVVAVSGGVDSAVTAKLAFEALDQKQLMVFTFDDGLRREGESEWVQKMFAEKLGIPVEIIQVKSLFFARLEGIENGDEKRIVYSDGFGTECGEMARDFCASFVFFGTNLLDRKETQRGQKQHNAWTDLGISTSEKYSFRAVEPIKTLLKEQIRELARELGIPPEISERMPFPGPGLAIRVFGSVTNEKIDLIRQITKIVEDNLLSLDLEPAQCLACLLGGKAITERGGKNLFGHMVAVKAVDSRDSLQTATTFEISKETKQKIKKEILSFPQVARVFFDVTDKPPGRIEYI